jgi:hypothetical protein
MSDNDIPELPPLNGEEPVPFEPVLDEVVTYADELENEDVEDYADPAKQIKRRRGRPKRFKHTINAEKQDMPIVSAGSPGRLLPADQLQKFDDFDLWIQQFDWDRPKMRSMLKRTSPSHHLGVSVGGQLASKDNAPFTFEEIRQRWGGGEYRVSIFGPKSKDDARQVPLAALRLQIPGNPLLDEDSLPAETRDKMQQNWGRGPRPTDPGTEAMKIVSSEVDALRRQVYDGPKGPDTAPYDRMTDEIKASAEQRIAAKEAAADERSRAATEMLAMEREERKRLAERLAEMEKGMYQKETEMRDKVAESIKEAQGGSLSLVSTLLPQMSDNAAQQVKMAIDQFSAREERIAAQHAQEVMQLHKMHEVQLQIQGQQHQMQMGSLAQMHDNNSTLLKAQIEGLKSEKEVLRQQLDEARRMVDRARDELMTRITSQKETNPLDQMSQFAQILDMAKSITGGGGDESGAGAGLEDNPILANIFKLGHQALPVVQEALAARRQAPQQMMPPPQQQQQVYYQQQPQRQVMVQQAPPSVPSAPPQQRLKKEDLVAAIAFINGVLSQPEPLPVNDVARGAIATQDNGVLKQLARRTPEKLMAKLEEEELLVGPCSSENGRAYMIALLKAIREKLAKAE